MVTQGITDKSKNFRSVPFAGSTFPLEMYLFVGSVEGLEKGIYKNDSIYYLIICLVIGDKKELCFAASN